MKLEKNLPSIDTILENCVKGAWRHSYIQIATPIRYWNRLLENSDRHSWKKNEKIARHCVRVPIERKKEKKHLEKNREKVVKSEKEKKEILRKK